MGETVTAVDQARAEEGCRLRAEKCISGQDTLTKRRSISGSEAKPGRVALLSSPLNCPALVLPRHVPRYTARAHTPLRPGTHVPNRKMKIRHCFRPWYLSLSIEPIVSSPYTDTRRGYATGPRGEMTLCTVR